MKSLYMQAVKNIQSAKGEAFNIGGGIKNSLSLIELFEFLEKELSVSLDYEKLRVRESDQKVFVANFSKASHLIEWVPQVSFKEGVAKTIDWQMQWFER
jgi:CDP-paratose 2-epimerase